MKPVALLVSLGCVLGAGQVQAVEDLSVVLHGVSIHSNCEEGKGRKHKTCDLENFNPGGAIDWGFYNSPDWGRLSLRAGAYDDSYNETAYYGGAVYMKTWDIYQGVQLGGGVQAGYLNGSGINGFAAMPMLVLGYDHLSLEVGYAPKVSWALGHRHVAVTSFALRWAF